MGLLLACVTSEDQFRVANDLVAQPLPDHHWHLLFGREPSGRSVSENYFATMLESMGDELAALSPVYGYEKDFPVAMGALASQPAIRVLIERADDKRAFSALSAAAGEHPERVGPILKAHVESKGAHHKRIAPLVERAATLAAAAESEVAPAAKSKTTTKSKTKTKTKSKTKTTTSSKSDESNTPQLLLDPPWTRPTPKKPKPITLERLPYEPSLQWAEGEREAFSVENWDPADLEPGGYLERLQSGNWAPPGDWREWTLDQWKTLDTRWETRFILVGTKPTSP